MFLRYYFSVSAAGCFWQRPAWKEIISNSTWKVDFKMLIDVNHVFCCMVYHHVYEWSSWILMEHPQRNQAVCSNSSIAIPCLWLRNIKSAYKHCLKWFAYSIDLVMSIGSIPLVHDLFSGIYFIEVGLGISWAVLLLFSTWASWKKGLIGSLVV